MEFINNERSAENLLKAKRVSIFQNQHSLYEFDIILNKIF